MIVSAAATIVQAAIPTTTLRTLRVAKSGCSEGVDEIGPSPSGFVAGGGSSANWLEGGVPGDKTIAAAHAGQISRRPTKILPTAKMLPH